MARTFRALSALLSYPTAELQAAAPDCRDAIEREQLLPAGARRQLDVLIEEIATIDLYDLQERYVLLFDREVGADDFRLNPELWNAAPVGEHGGARLYELR